MEASGFRWPNRRMVANLAPGALRKEGTHFDLAFALGILAEEKQIDDSGLEGYVAIGELALDGAVRPVRGALAAAIAAHQAGRKGLICPAGNAPEAALVGGLDVVPVSTLKDCIAWVKRTWEPLPVETRADLSVASVEDMREVRGHPTAKRALEIAAAGGHNLLLIGPPGSGKTMLARRLPGILPRMSLEESLEVTRIHSVAGLLIERAALVTTRPFRVPHHNITVAGLIGGGSGIALPGEVSLAHNGSLFLDELGLYRPTVLDSLRAPLEDGTVRIARSGGSIAYPCRFALIAAMNPCPCGYLGDGLRACRCSGHQLQLYNGRLSGPLLDRFDMQVSMARLTKRELLGQPEGETSAAIRDRVERGRAVQAERYESPVTTNSSACKAELDAALSTGAGARVALEGAIDSLMLSGRGVDRVLRVARTIADLEGEREIGGDHLHEALMFRAQVREAACVG